MNSKVPIAIVVVGRECSKSLEGYCHPPVVYTSTQSTITTAWDGSVVVVV